MIIWNKLMSSFNIDWVNVYLIWQENITLDLFVAISESATVNQYEIDNIW